MYQWIDSHAHLSGEQTWANVQGIVQRAKEAGIENIVNICTDSESLQKGLELSAQYPWIFNTAATTPHDVDSEGAVNFQLFSDHAKKGSLVAIGETGLDYHYEHSKKETQKAFLIKYLQLAIECRLPVVIHCREAFRDLFEIIDSEYRGYPGVLHCFTGTVEEALDVIDRGWYVSLSGIITFKKSEGLRNVAKRVPLDKILIETDTPYLAPQSKRGKPNESSFLPEIAQTIAEVKNLKLETVAEATRNNTKNLFNLP